MKNVTPLFYFAPSESIHQLSDRALHEKLVALSQEERKLTTTILDHLREVEVRKLYAHRGYPSLFEYVVKELGFSEGAAHRRISSMRLTNEVPELRMKIEEGSLKLNQLAQVQRFLKEEKKTGRIYSREEKRSLLGKLENCSSRETEQRLVAISPSMVPLAEKIRPMSDAVTRLEVSVTPETIRKLDRIHELATYRVGFGAGYGRMIEWMADQMVKQLEKEKGLDRK